MSNSNDNNNNNEDNDISSADDAKLFGQEFLGNLYNKLYASLKSKSNNDDNINSSSESPLFLRQVKDKINSLATDNHDNNDKECAVCLEEYTIAKASIILKCAHILCQVTYF